jgi:hypothetical protein
MSDIESDYRDCESAKDIEGGLHPGRSGASRGLVLTLVLIAGLLIFGMLALALLPR